MSQLSRRDFLKLSTSAIAGIGLLPLRPGPGAFEDSQQVRVATKSISVYSRPTDKSSIVSQRFRDELLNVYEEVDSGTPAFNPIWYRAWGGFVHRSRLQKIKTLLHKPLDSIAEGTRLVAELNVPYSQAMRFTKTYGWQPNLRLYYGSVHWITGIDEGPDGEPWYRIHDELVGYPYHVAAIHLRPVPFEEWSPISSEIPLEDKRIDVSLTNQTLTAYERDALIFETRISSGIDTPRQANALSTKTPSGAFRIMSKYPSKHMGNGSLFASLASWHHSRS